MDLERWQENWRSGRIGFHQSEVSPPLLEHQNRLLAAPAQRVLVPLCGKSLDLAFLASLGHAVVGVEFVEAAARAFFEERGGVPRTSTRAGMQLFAGGGVEILVGDFFAVDARHTGRVDAVFDRAALVAVHPHRRGDYAGKLAELVAPGGRVLLVTLAYDQSRAEGPPSSVPDTEVRALFTPSFAVEHLSAGPTTRIPERMANAGVTEISETVWFLTRR